MNLRMAATEVESMPEPALRLDANSSDQPAFWKRIHENILSLWTMPRVAFSSSSTADGLAIHLLDHHRENAGLRAQAGSTGLHVFVFAALVFAIAHPLVKPKRTASGETIPVGPIEFSAPKWMREAAEASLGKRGVGGDLNPLPPTAGELAP
jgi:hypothetical protein